VLQNTTDTDTNTAPTMITKGEGSTNYGFFPSIKLPKSSTRISSHADAMTVAGWCGAKLRRFVSQMEAYEEVERVTCLLFDSNGWLYLAVCDRPQISHLDYECSLSQRYCVQLVGSGRHLKPMQIGSLRLCNGEAV
jgi:hypothetical protein